MAKLALYFHVSEYRKPDEGIASEVESYFEEEKKYSETFPETQIKKGITSKVDHIVFKYIDCWRIKNFLRRTFLRELSATHKKLFSLINWYVQVDSYSQLQEWKEKEFEGTWRDWMDFISSPYFENGMIRYLKPRYKIYFDNLPKSEPEPRNFYKSINGRNMFIKNNGNFRLFKQEMNKAYLLHQKN